MSSRCKICKTAPACFCKKCGPHQAAPELVRRDDIGGLAQVEERAREIMREIDSKLPPGWGAMLLFAQFGHQGYSTYISTMDRSTMPTFLRETATMIEERSDEAPGVLGRTN
jgi:hypothetical protein